MVDWDAKLENYYGHEIVVIDRHADWRLVKAVTHGNPPTVYWVTNTGMPIPDWLDDMGEDKRRVRNPPVTVERYHLVGKGGKIAATNFLSEESAIKYGVEQGPNFDCAGVICITTEDGDIKNVRVVTARGRD